MRTQEVNFRTRISVQQSGRIPAGDTRQIKSSQCLCESGRLARKFVPELHALKADPASLGKTSLQRSLSAELAQIVVRPDDGVRTDSNGHSSLILTCQRTRCDIPLARRSNLGTFRNRGHRNVPPV